MNETPIPPFLTQASTPGTTNTQSTTQQTGGATGGIPNWLLIEVPLVNALLGSAVLAALITGLFSLWIDRNNREHEKALAKANRLHEEKLEKERQTHAEDLQQLQAKLARQHEIEKQNSEKLSNLCRRLDLYEIIEVIDSSEYKEIKSCFDVPTKINLEILERTFEEGCRNLPSFHQGMVDIIFEDHERMQQYVEKIKEKVELERQERLKEISKPLRTFLIQQILELKNKLQQSE